MELNLQTNGKMFGATAKDPKLQMIGDFLSSSIQGSKTMATNVLEKIVSVTDGKSKKYEMTFNAHALEVEKKDDKYVFFMENIWDDEEEPLELDVGIIIDALKKWISFLSSKK